MGKVKKTVKKFFKKGTGTSKVVKEDILTNQQNDLLNNLINQAQQNNTFLSDYLKNIITGGTDSARVQAAVTNYKENVVPQILDTLGEGKSSSALNQAMSTGAQQLAQNIDADVMSAVQMLQQLTQGNSALGLGTQAVVPLLQPGKTQTAWNALAQLLAGQAGGVLGSLSGGVIPWAGKGIKSIGKSVSSWVKRLF